MGSLIEEPINHTILRPDTCFCVLDYTDNVFLKRCRIHTNSTFRQREQHNAQTKFQTTGTEETRTEKRRIEKETTRR